MLHKTRGIVFKSFDYGETSLVAHIYTELFGIQSYIINSVRKKHARVHSNIFQPLTLVDLVVYHKERPGLQRISDIRPSPPLQNIPLDLYKGSMVFFLDQVLYKSIREEESNPPLFEFIYNSILMLDEQKNPGNDFHLIFLIRLTKFLGFAPTKNYSPDCSIFNLKEGYFQTEFPKHPNFIPDPHSKFFAELINANYDAVTNLSNQERKLLINFMLEYFALHIEGFGNIQSHKVLEQVWE